MSSQFGYVEIKNGQVICYTGDSQKPQIHRFDNDEIVNAVKSHPILLENFKKLRAWANEELRLMNEWKLVLDDITSERGVELSAREGSAKIVLQMIGE